MELFWQFIERIIGGEYKLSSMRLYTSNKYRYFYLLSFENSTFTKNLRIAHATGGKVAEKQFYLEYLKELEGIYFTWYIIWSFLFLLTAIVNLTMMLYFVTLYVTIPTFLLIGALWIISQRQKTGYLMNGAFYALNEAIYNEQIQDELK